MYFTQTSQAYLINAERMNPPREKSTTTSSYLPEPLGWEVDGKKSARTRRRFSARAVRRDGGRSERKEDGSVVRVEEYIPCELSGVRILLVPVPAP